MASIETSLQGCNISEEKVLSPREIASIIAKKQNCGDDVKSLIFSPSHDEKIKISIQQQIKEKKRADKKKMKNHQVKHRQDLLELSRLQEQRDNERSEKQRSIATQKEKMKKKQFGHIQSKFRVSSSSSSSTSTVPSAAETIMSRSSNCTSATSLSSLSHSVATNDEKSRPKLHSCFGKIPKYILKQRAADYDSNKVKDSLPLENDESSSQNTTFPINQNGCIKMKDIERKRIFDHFEEQEKHVHREISKLPFTLHGDGHKRTSLNKKLKEIEEAKALFGRKGVLLKL